MTRPETNEIWLAAFDVLRARSNRWQYIRRLTESHSDHVEPSTFCDDVIADAMTNRSFLNTSERASFFDWACAQTGIKAFVPVAAAHDLMSRGDRGRALPHLSLALVLDQEDLYAQELWFAARGEPISRIDSDKWFCSNPFKRIESASRNRLMFCCPAWLPVAAGNLEDASAEDVWNSQAAQDIRASIHDGSYKYCSRMHCPRFGGEAESLERIDEIKNPELKKIVAKKATVLSTRIDRIALAHDRSCNISCPSCRTKLIIADKAETSRLDQLTDQALFPLILSSRRITITGSGDPFSSKHYRNIIRKLTARDDGPIIDLQTNGLMLKRSWDALGLEGRVGNVLLSIDATEKETYEVIRRGGVFEELLENLAYLSELRQRGSVAHVRLDFVVQARNFRQMVDAIGLTRDHGFDAIKFQMLRSWNTWSPEEFERQHVGHPGHPDHEEFQAILRNPCFSDPDVLLSGFYAS